MEKTVILANGAYPVHPYPAGLLHKAEVLVCTDGAVVSLKDREPTWIVGDMDSIPLHLKKKYASRLVCDRCQETNDLTKAVCFCLSKGIRRLTILGGTGKREDHTLGNISLLGTYAQMLDEVCMVTDNGIFHALPRTEPNDEKFSCATLNCRPGEPVSFFATRPGLRLRAEGVKYPVEEVIFDQMWKATLNECISDRLVLSFSHGPLLVYFTLPAIPDIPVK
ncbi:MAG TPA: thiamine diphosphokinase [Bacteroidales bacterium]|nr:thiamine diphosphokinase [Bacteroidales bacterium]